MAAGKEMEIAIRIAGKVESSLKNALGTATKGIGKVAKVAAQASIAAGAAVRGLAAAGVNVGKEFESAMSQVSATMLLDRFSDDKQKAAEAQKAYETLEGAARECGATTAFSATEAAEALNYLALAGYDADKAAGALPTVLNLAGAGAMSLADASDMVTDAMSALNIEATEDNLTAFADNLAKTASKSNTSVAQLGEAILTVGGTAQGLKGGTTELSTIAGILADSGIKASEGGTHIRNMIQSLQMPRNSSAGDMFKALGLQAYDAEGNMRSLGDVFGDLNAQLSGASAEEVNRTLSTIFKQTDLAAARAMMAATTDSMTSLGTVVNASLAESGTSLDKLGMNLGDMVKDFDAAMSQEEYAAQAMKQFGITGEQAGLIYSGLQSVVSGTGNRFRELSGYIEDSAGACEDMYKIQLDNLEGDLKILGSAASDLGISFYKDVNGPLRESVQFASNMVTQLNDAYKDGGLSAMVGEVGNCLSEIVDAFADYAPKIMEVGVDVIENLVRGVTQSSGKISESGSKTLAVFAEGLFKLVPDIIFAGIDIVTQLADSLAAQAPQLLSSGTQAVSSFVNGLIQRGPSVVTAALNLVQTLVNSILQNAPQLIAAAVQLIESLLTGIAQMLPQLAMMAVQLVGGLAQGIVSNLPSILQTGVQVITSLVTGISQMLPNIIQYGIQIVISLLQGIIANLGNIAQAAIQIVITLATGLIQAIPQLMMAVPQLIQAIIDCIANTDWLSVGIQIIQGLINGILSTGESLWSAIKSLFTGGDVDVSDSGAQATQSYAAGIQNNSQAVTAAASSLSNTAFSSMDLTGATNAGVQAGAAFSTGLSESMATGTGMDAFTQSMATAGTQGADALNTSIKTSLDTTLVQGMMESGTQGGDALSAGITNNSQTVVAAADTLGQQVGTSFDTSWQQVTSRAQSAMQNLVSAVSSGARQAASAVKSAFENMTITIPKPRIPTISVSTESVAYGEEGSVKVPQFSVNWNAIGGIFERPTIFNTGAGMQGVGEAGAEAVLPLDTLWARMRDIVSQEVRANSGTSIVGTLLDKLSSISTGGQGGRNAPQLATAGGPPIQYSPTYNLYGTAGKKEVTEADRMSQAEFNRMMKRWQKDNGRTKF